MKSSLLRFYGRPSLSISKPLHPSNRFPVPRVWASNPLFVPAPATPQVVSPSCSSPSSPRYQHSGLPNVLKTIVKTRNQPTGPNIARYSFCDMASSAPLVWIDCEMTGLDVVNDTIIEICCYITDSNLKLLTPEPLNLVINKPKEVMDKMNEWCVKQHGQSGLTEEVLASSNTTETVRPALLAFIKQHVPYPRYGILAGNSVHADRMFLQKEYPEVVDYLHYRIMDVSTVKECVKMWCSNEMIRKIPAKKGLHRAKDDILESIQELKMYRESLFLGK